MAADHQHESKRIQQSNRRHHKQQTKPRRITRHRYERKKPTYAHTCVPCSGIMVNLTSVSVKRTQATFPIDDREPTKPMPTFRISNWSLCHMAMLMICHASTFPFLLEIHLIYTTASYIVRERPSMTEGRQPDRQLQLSNRVEQGDLTTEKRRIALLHDTHLLTPVRHRNG